MSEGELAEPEPRFKKAGFADEALPHLDAVYRFALRLASGREARAEDLVQETFLRAYRSWHTYTRGTNCRSWLFTICRNRFLRGNERYKRHPEQPASEFEADVLSFALEGAFGGDRAPDPEQEFLDSFVDREVMAAIDRLPDEFREAVILSDLEGLSYAEIVGVLDLPLGTVKSRLYRGRRRLRDELRDYAIEIGYLSLRGDA